MESEKVNREKLVKVQESELLALVAAKLKGKVLFPEKLENAKKYIKLVSSSAL